MIQTLKTNKKSEIILANEYSKSMLLMTRFPVDQVTEDVMVDRSFLKCISTFREMVRESVKMCNIAYKMGADSQDAEHRGIYQKELRAKLKLIRKKLWYRALNSAIWAAYEAGEQTWKGGENER